MGRVEKYLYTRNNWLQGRMGYLDAEEASGRVRFVRRMFTLTKDGMEEALAWADEEAGRLEGKQAQGFRDELASFRAAMGDGS